MAGIHITDIEAAINWWRDRRPSPDGITACAEVRALAEVYALMVYYRESLCDERTMPARAKQAWLDWYATTPDAPCIAICSTSQGDAVCKGCGRTFEEVRRWTTMTPAEKRETWRRLTLEGTAWRFNRYADRARRSSGDDPPPATLPAAPGEAVQSSAAAIPAPAGAASEPDPARGAAPAAGPAPASSPRAAGVAPSRRPARRPAAPRPRA